jgi:hypothetical protein
MRTERSIVGEVGSWSGVTTGDNGREGVQFLYGKVELGHMHGHHVAHLPMPRVIRDELIEEGRATPHPVLPNSGWVQRLIASSGDTDDVIALFRLNYERASTRSRFSTREVTE